MYNTKKWQLIYSNLPSYLMVLINTANSLHCDNMKRRELKKCLTCECKTSSDRWCQIYDRYITAVTKIKQNPVTVWGLCFHDNVYKRLEQLWSTNTCAKVLNIWCSVCEMKCFSFLKYSSIHANRSEARRGVNRFKSQNEICFIWMNFTFKFECLCIKTLDQNKWLTTQNSHFKMDECEETSESLHT